ncbi:MAG: hypothetical protein M3Z75_30750 [Actinomycetota bacterium]|nr:hypothetical protein [Actinomycetota bacterium]
MSIDEADQPAPAAGVRSDAASPLLRTLGDRGAAVCADGFCEVPPGQLAAPGQAGPGQAGPGQAAPGQAGPGQAAPGQAVTMGADE